MSCILRKPAGHESQSYQTAPILSSERTHSGYDQARHGYGKDCIGASQSGQTLLVYFGKINPVDVAKRVW